MGAGGAEIKCIEEGAVVVRERGGTQSANFFSVFFFLGFGGEAVGISAIKGTRDCLLHSDHLS